MQQHILIISNETTLYKALLNLEPPYTLSYAKNAQESLEIINTLTKTQPLCVILDTQLKELNALDLLKALYLQVISAKYLVLDSKEDINTAVYAYQHGASLYMKHPSTNNLETLKQFSNTIQRLFSEHVTQKQLNDAFFWDNIYSRSHLEDMYYLLELKVQRNLQQHLKAHHVSNNTPQLLDQLYTSKHLTLSSLEQALSTLKESLPKPIKKPLLLIIEDEPFNQKLAQKQLNNSFEILPALNGKEALDLLKKHPSIRLILLDIYLPDVQGEMLYKQIKNINNQASVIAFTAYEESNIAKTLIQQGAYDYINKPYKKHDLMQKLNKAWLRQCWPFFEGKLNIQELSYLHRAIFLDYLIKKRLEKRAPLYELDYLALFPELLDIKVSQ